jgi:hypothetical protein
LWVKIKNMNDFLAQIILVARNRDGKSWTNILFIVFLAIFWVISGILKAKKNAQEKKAGGQGLVPKPGGKPAEDTKAKPKGPFQQIRAAVEAELQKQRELQLQAQKPRRKVVHPKPTVRKVAINHERAGIHTIEPTEETKLPRAVAQVEPKLEKLPEFTSKTVKAVADKRTAAAARGPQAGYLSEIMLDYSDPDDLKRAILHYEILGRPLSLRDPSGRIIGL